MKIRAIFLLLAVFITANAVLTTEAQRRRTKAAPKKPVTANVPAGAKPGASKPALSAKGAADADGWKLYQASPDDFRVAFPSVPAAAFAASEKPGDPEMNRYYLPQAITTGSQSLSVFVWSMDKEIDDPDELAELYKGWLTGAMEAAPGAAKPVLVLDREFAIGNRAGFEVILDQGDSRMHAKLIMVGAKFYQLVASSRKPAAEIGNEAAEIEKSANKFMRSFEVTFPVKIAAPGTAKVESGAAPIGPAPKKIKKAI